jgi:hypothetical protein
METKSKSSWTLIVPLLAVTVITPNFMLASKAEARPCGSDWLSRLGCTIDPTNPRENGSVFQSSFNVYVTNNSRKPIAVTARYMNYYAPGRGSCSTTDGRGENCPATENWVTENWSINPGENAFIINNAKSRYIYFSARSLDGAVRWNEKQVDMGPNYQKFTYTFNE